MKKFIVFLFMLAVLPICVFAVDQYDFLYNDNMFKSNDVFSNGNTLREKADIDLETAIKAVKEREFVQMLTKAYRIEIKSFAGNVEICVDDNVDIMHIESSDFSLVKIPSDEKLLEIDAGDADIKIVIPSKRFIQNIRVDTLAGAVAVRGVKCFDYSITTMYGAVSIACANVPEKIDVETYTGDIDVRVPADREISVIAKSDTGITDSDFPFRKARMRTYDIQSRKGNVSVKKS